jgi:hypothetical protein
MGGTEDDETLHQPSLRDEVLVSFETLNVGSLVVLGNTQTNRDKRVSVSSSAG